MASNQAKEKQNKNKESCTYGVMNETISEALIDKAISGDSTALHELCDAIGRRVMFLVMRKLHKKMDAEDATQEILIRMCNNIKGLKDSKSFNAWLYSIVINETRRHYNASCKHDEVLNMDDYSYLLDEENDMHLPHEYIMRSEEARAIIGVVDTLPERQQEAVILHYYQGFGVVETAQIMGTTQPAISRYLKLAREKLKMVWEDEYGNDHFVRGGAALPMGPLFAQALQQEAGQFDLVAQTDVGNILGSCAAQLADAAAAVGTQAAADATSVSAEALPAAAAVAAAAGATAAAGTTSAYGGATVAATAASTAAATSSTATAAAVTGTAATVGASASGTAVAGTVVGTATTAAAVVAGAVATAAAVPTGVIAACIGAGAAVIAVTTMGIVTHFGNDTMHYEGGPPVAIVDSSLSGTENYQGIELQESSGRVVFSGGKPSVAHVNPTHAEASVTGFEATTIDWQITEQGDSAVLYSGTGGIVDGALINMQERGEVGIYVLYFTLHDGGGGEYFIHHNFQICDAFS